MAIFFIDFNYIRTNIKLSHQKCNKFLQPNYVSAKFFITLLLLHQINGNNKKVFNLNEKLYNLFENTIINLNFSYTLKMTY